MIRQLRIYEINPSLKKEFHERFKNHAMRIMESYNFDIVSMWDSDTEGRTEFVYLLRWPDTATMNSQWEKFITDQEWIDIKERTLEKTGQMVLGKVRDQVLRAVD